MAPFAKQDDNQPDPTPEAKPEEKPEKVSKEDAEKGKNNVKAHPVEGGPSKVTFPKGKKIFKSNISGLSVPTKGGTDLNTRYERFRPYTRFNKTLGEVQRFGLLVTADPVAIKVCEADSNVEEISEKDYKELVADQQVSSGTRR